MKGVDSLIFFFFQAEDGIRDLTVTGVQTCALPIYREERVLERIARHAEEDVTLVLAMIDAAEQRLLAVDGIDAHARVVAGGDEIGADGLGIARQLAELEPVVTANAGIRRSAAVVFR